jgi:hypothetical protein
MEQSAPNPSRIQVPLQAVSNAAHDEQNRLNRSHLELRQDLMVSPPKPLEQSNYMQFSQQP